MPVDLEADSSDSDDDIFIFIIGIHTTSRIGLLLFFILFGVPALLLQQRKVCNMTVDYLPDKYTS